MVINPEIFDRHVSFTLYNDPYDNRVLDSNRCHDVAWGDFVEIILTKRAVRPNKEDVGLLAPVRFLAADDPACQHAPFTPNEAQRGLGREDELKLDSKGNPYTWRGASNVESWWMLPVDIDGQQSITQARAFFADYTYVAFTSFSHLADGKTEKFRLFLLLEKSVAHEEFEKRRGVLLSWMGRVDQSSLAASRGFYLPSCPAERSPFAQRWYNDGSKCLDVMSFRAPVAKAIAPPKPMEPANHSVLLELLRERFLGKYEDWWKVSVAMVSSGFSFADFEYVTVGGMMSQKDTRDCQQQWRKAQARVRRGGVISVGYLYNLVGGGEVIRKRRTASIRRELEQEIERLKTIVGGVL